MMHVFGFFTSFGHVFRFLGWMNNITMFRLNIPWLFSEKSILVHIKKNGKKCLIFRKTLYIDYAISKAWHSLALKTRDWHS